MIIRHRRTGAVLSALTAITLFAAPNRSVSAQAPSRSSAKSDGHGGASSATIRVTAALVLPDMTVRPVPLHALDLVAEADTTRHLALRTGLDGSAGLDVTPGRYRLRSIQPATLNDSTYRWDLAVEVPAAGTKVELTNANATVASAAKRVARQVAPEREVFERVKHGVFRVESGLGHGSGFLAEVPGVPGGLVVTNDHVVADATTASVYIDSVTRVPAQVVARDRDADMAVLRIPASRCATCPRLALAAPKSGEDLVVAGERVLAIGFPLSQEMTLTSGIASSVRSGAIISDVNINHGNSGGPMLNLAGEVVGVNAFGDFTTQGGPGISGAIAITRIRPLLERVPAALAQLPPLEDRALPTVPQAAYPVALLKQIADTAKPQSYRFLIERPAGRFTVTVTTPVVYMVQRKVAENEVAGDRRKREAKARVADDERYSELKQSRDWEQYVGDQSTPVVAITIVPKIAETGGSILARSLQAGLTGYATGRAKFKFQGDVRGARFYRNGVEIEPIRGGHGPQAVRVEERWVQLKDVADMGYYVLPPEAFAPDSTGAPAMVTVTIQDLKNPGSLSAVDFWGETSARVWNDFGPYFTAAFTDRAWRAADRTREVKVPLTCDAESGWCEPKR